ncbi:thioredoxin domain-containing protein [Staphylococcus epidermidis]|nr:thioredoxin domain-containing protein [Staphylococcus epidermidis]
MKKLIGLLMILCMVLLYSCSGPMDSPKHSNNSKPVVVIYGDYKCPYCKKTEDRVMPKLKKKYIDTNKIKYQYVNLAFLGKDSIVGSRAQHAVNHYAPKKSLEFQKLMFNQQKDEHKQWITTRLVDKQIDKLSISDDKKKKKRLIIKLKVPSRGKSQGRSTNCEEKSHQANTYSVC